MPVVAENREGRRLFTADELSAMEDAGLFPGERLELLDGEIHVVVTQNPPHAGVVGRLTRLLSAAYGTGFTVRAQLPADVPGRRSRLEPDLAVVETTARWDRRHPLCAETRLLIEVADTNVPVARQKARIYAEAGTPVYWLVDIPRRRVVVHTEPQADGTWRSAEAPDVLALPGLDAGLAVSEVLPAEQPADD